MNARTFAIRTIIAFASVILIFFGKKNGLNPVLYGGYLFFTACLLMYLKSLYKALFHMHKVTADLLVVTVMIITAAAGRPVSGALVAWFISMGLAISFYVIEHTQKKIYNLTARKEKKARIVNQNGITDELPVNQVKKGDTVLVPQGEMVPVDGIIVQGSALMDEAVITGEPYTVFRGKGDYIISGTICVDSQIKVEASKPGNNSFMYILADRIASSMKNKPEVQRKADKIVQFFISGVVLYAFAFLVIYGFITGDWSAALMRTAAITAVACPCAWALSVPTAFAASIGGLSRHGVLVKGGIPLELAGKIKNVILDKTGTLTLSRPRVETVQGITMDDNEILQLAAGVETGFKHPISTAVAEYAKSKKISINKSDSHEYLPGLGVKARVKGREVLLATKETMEKMKIKIPDNIKINGRAVWIAVDNSIAGLLTIQDELRASAADIGRLFKKSGIKQVFLATGDSEEAEVKRVASQIGADRYRSSMLPQDKTMLAKDLSSQGGVMMIGDGVNDADAMAVSDVSMAVGMHKADLAMESADIILLNEDAAMMPKIIETGKKLGRIININYAWAIGFNAVGIVLATTGTLPPWAAALLHHGSSVFVVANSARLVRISPDKT